VILSVESDNVEDGQASQGLLRTSGQQKGDHLHRRRQHAGLRGLRRAASSRANAPVSRPQVLVRTGTFGITNVVVVVVVV